MGHTTSHICLEFRCVLSSPFWAPTGEPFVARQAKWSNWMAQFRWSVSRGLSQMQLAKIDTWKSSWWGCVYQNLILHNSSMLNDVDTFEKPNVAGHLVHRTKSTCPFFSCQPNGRARHRLVKREAMPSCNVPRGMKSRDGWGAPFFFVKCHRSPKKGSPILQPPLSMIKHQHIDQDGSEQLQKHEYPKFLEPVPNFPKTSAATYADRTIKSWRFVYTMLHIFRYHGIWANKKWDIKHQQVEKKTHEALLF